MRDSSPVNFKDTGHSVWRGRRLSAAHSGNLGVKLTPEAACRLARPQIWDSGGDSVVPGLTSSLQAGRRLPRHMSRPVLSNSQEPPCHQTKEWPNIQEEVKSLWPITKVYVTLDVS
jgi:hypothetical protein